MVKKQHYISTWPLSPKQIILFFIVHTFLREEQWLIGEEETIFLLRNSEKECALSPAKIQLALKTIIIPKAYHLSMAKGLSQECIIIQEDSLQFFSSQENKVVSLTIGNTSLSDLLKEIKGQLESCSSIQFYFIFTNNFAQLIKEDCSSKISNFLGDIERNYNNIILKKPLFTKLWDHWYG